MSSAGSPVSWIQRRFLDAPDSLCVQTTWDVGARIDAAAAAHALAALAHHQPMLRTGFERSAGGWSADLRLRIDGSRHVRDIDAQAWGDGQLLDDFRQHTAPAFDMTDPPFALRLYRRPHGRTIVMLVLHHAIADGWGLANAASQFWICYAAAIRGGEPGLPPLTRDYRDYVAAESTFLASDVARHQIERWRARLAGVPALDPPVDRPRAPQPQRRSAFGGFVLDALRWRALQTRAAALKTTPFVLALTAYTMVIREWTGRREFCVGTSTAGRSSEPFRDVVGCFVNPVAVRTAIDGNDFRQTFDQLRARLFEAMANRDVPFAHLIRALEPPADRPPFFETMFIMLNVFDLDRFRQQVAQALSLAAGEVHLVHPVPNARCRYDFETLAYVYDGRLHGAIEYDADLFEASTIERLSRRYEAMILAIVEGAEPAVRSVAS